jgi:hypothetical protein
MHACRADRNAERTDSAVAAGDLILSRVLVIARVNVAVAILITLHSCCETNRLAFSVEDRISWSAQ